ncbi:hypothetical protein OVA03_12705 [Asticcacaulis sp. SL142]|uniref:hypothetical protein n=1 Tax=Asticcacaulis sp. SL142 TaxID=2995155 RepID=UPI00226CDBCE|nr:hypothetical protein [Asticcacaulis sp. SL142]WAC47556.1 hypothetical protein OVA03_12705 [Asticcacaulis sp. SL142]
MSNGLAAFCQLLVQQKLLFLVVSDVLFQSRNDGFVFRIDNPLQRLAYLLINLNDLRRQCLALLILGRRQTLPMGAEHLGCDFSQIV